MIGISIRRAAAAVLLTGLALFSAGCDKLKARDHINSGTAAFKAGNFAESADHFKTAIALDPSIPNIRIYLATAYIQQYIPGTETAENKKYAEAAMAELVETLKTDPKNVLATAYIASLYYQMKDFTKALEWNRKVVELDPKDKAALYTLGVIPWTQFIGPDREARNASKMKAEDPGPIKDKKVKEELRQRNLPLIEDGLNINVHCGSTHPRLLQKAVVAEKTSIGMAFGVEEI